MDGSLGRGRVAAANAADVATPAFLSQTVAVSTATIIGDGGSRLTARFAATDVSRSCGDVAVAVPASATCPGGSASPSGPPTWTCASGSTVGRHHARRHRERGRPVGAVQVGHVRRGVVDRRSTSVRSRARRGRRLRPAVVGVVGRLRGGIEGGVESVMRPPLTGRSRPRRRAPRRRQCVAESGTSDTWPFSAPTVPASSARCRSVLRATAMIRSPLSGLAKMTPCVVRPVALTSAVAERTILPRSMMTRTSSSSSTTSAPTRSPFASGRLATLMPRPPRPWTR